MVQFCVDATHGLARVGTLKTHTTLFTPTYLVQTKDGNPLYLTTDMLVALKEAQALHITIQDVIELKDVLQKYGKGAHKLFNLDKYTLFLSLRDSKVFVECPSANADSISVVAKKGNIKLSTQTFVKLIAAAQVDIFTSMFFDVAWDSSLKRAKKSVDLALVWLDSVLQQLPDNTKGGIFGVVEGSRFLDQRIKSAKDTALRPVAGFIIGGLETGETPQERATVLDAVLKNLPDDKPRMVVGPGCPEDVLELIEKGVDVFCNSYPHFMTEQGYALSFALDPSQEVYSRKMNMRDPVYIIDSQPLIIGCTCYTCTSHTRAYIHHLLNVHEMLAEVLLEIHNLHHYLEFFRIIREHIRAGDFESYKMWFLMHVSKLSGKK